MNSINNQTEIKNFISQEKNTVLKVGTDRNGRKYLQAVNKNSLNFLWFWIASKILHLKNYQLETVVSFIKNPQFSETNLEIDDLNKFYSIMNRKIQHFNETRTQDQKIQGQFETLKIRTVSTKEVKKNFSETVKPTIQENPSSIVSEKTSQAEIKDSTFTDPLKELNVEGSSTKSRINAELTESNLSKIDPNHGAILREKAESLLNDKPNGTGLLRYSENQKSYVLTCKLKTEACEHWKLNQKEVHHVLLHNDTLEEIRKQYKIETILLPNGEMTKNTIHWHWFLPVYQSTLDLTYQLHVNLKEQITQEVQNYNQNRELKEKLKISFESNKIILGYSANEFYTILTIPGLEKLHDYFGIAQKNIFTHPQYFIFKYTYLDPISKSDLEEKYRHLSKSHASSLPISLPNLPNFQGTKEEIQNIFSSLLKDHEGLVIGEYSHKDLMPKKLLEQHMKDLYNNGVRTLFLEFCCYDTLQPELDEFFQTKKPSPFLKEFLEQAFGRSVYSTKEQATAYYQLIQAAVNTGIRPIGLENSRTLRLGYQSIGGSSGDSRMLGLNVIGKEIIDKHKHEGKYLVFVGTRHTSYTHDIAGFSELCHIPNLVIKDQENNQANEYKSHLKNLGENASTKVKELFGNTQHNHYNHVQLILKKP